LERVRERSGNMGAPTSLEFHGTEVSVAEQAKMVQMIASDRGGTHFAEVPVEKVHIGDIIAVKSGARITLAKLEGSDRIGHGRSPSINQPTENRCRSPSS
jgi:hypothetical protein